MDYNQEVQFSNLPKLNISRSVFDRSHSHKMTMDVDYFYPIFIDEMIPGDTANLDFQVFGRLINPLVAPIMDELYFETLWFKCPMRLLWTNTFKFFGERENPDDSNDYVIPTITVTSSDNIPNSIFDHMGLNPLVTTKKYNSLPFRMYNLVFNSWLRNQNLINSVPVPLDDSDDVNNYTLLKSTKIHDVFVSMLPSPQLGDPVQIPIGMNAPVIGTGIALGLTDGVREYGAYSNEFSTTTYNAINADTNAISKVLPGTITTGTIPGAGYAIGVSTDPTKSGLSVDLSSATGININDFRFLMRLQRYREQLMLGGHRYREIISRMFGVDQLDNRAYIPEFLGMTSEMIDINNVIQTSSTDTTSPQGNLTAFGVVSHHKSGFTTSAVEHSYLLGLARIRHIPVYQQGTNKLWTRETSLDFYNPAFNGLGEQPVLSQEIVTLGDDQLDTNGDVIDKKAVGFQEAWYEYRYYPSYITGQIRSGIPQSLDLWHLGQFYGTQDPTSLAWTQTPVTLNQSFIESDIPLGRVLSVDSNSDRGIVQFVMDFRFNYICTRPMPVHNVPADLTGGF